MTAQITETLPPEATRDRPIHLHPLGKANLLIDHFIGLGPRQLAAEAPRGRLYSLVSRTVRPEAGRVPPEAAPDEGITPYIASFRRLIEDDKPADALEFLGMLPLRFQNEPSLKALESLPILQATATLIAGFGAAREENFESTSDSALRKTLNNVLNSFSGIAVKAFASALNTEAADPEIVGEALRWLGAVEHPETREDRRVLLEQILSLGSARRRYVAAVALATLDDPSALPALRITLRREPNATIRRTVERVIRQLEATR